MTSPGDIIMAGFNASKMRPWLILWVDEGYDEVCVAALTTQVDHVGSFEIESTGKGSTHIASWVTLQKLSRVSDLKPVGHVAAEERARIDHVLRQNLGFDVLEDEPNIRDYLVPEGTAEGGASFEAEIRWALDAVKRGDKKLAEDRLKRILKGPNP